MQRKVTYRNLATWYTELREFRPEIPCIVVANKIDGGPSLLLGVCSPRGPTTLPQNSALVACHHPVLSQAAPFLHTDASEMTSAGDTPPHCPACPTFWNEGLQQPTVQNSLPCQ